MESRDESKRSSRWVTRGVFAVAVAIPAVWLGGVLPETLIAFAALLVVVFLRLGFGRTSAFRLPRGLWLFALVILVCLFHWAPIHLVGLVAPRIAASTAAALEGTEIRWARVSVLPGQTLFDIETR